MKLRNEKDWKKCVEANTDGYGASGVRFAENWADLMEVEIAKGKPLEEIAESTSFIAAKAEGITGFQYGCAVSILSQVWIHGEQLRRWHNLDTQVRDEGEKANEKGTVLNPALLNIEPTK